MLRVKTASRRPIQFSTHNPENILVIESYKDGVVIRAANDNFSIRRKAFLIRQLAAEGYIPDNHEQCTEHLWPRNLAWIVDRSLVFIGPDATRRSNRTMRRLIMGGCALWIVEMALLVLTAR